MSRCNSFPANHVCFFPLKCALCESDLLLSCNSSSLVAVSWYLSAFLPQGFSASQTAQRKGLHERRPTLSTVSSLIVAVKCCFAFAALSALHLYLSHLFSTTFFLPLARTFGRLKVPCMIISVAFNLIFSNALL